MESERLVSEVSDFGREGEIGARLSCRRFS
jgi:hypothetical protein